MRRKRNNQNNSNNENNNSNIVLQSREPTIVVRERKEVNQLCHTLLMFDFPWNWVTVTSGSPNVFVGCCILILTFTSKSTDKKPPIAEPTAHFPLVCSSRSISSSTYYHRETACAGNVCSWRWQVHSMIQHHAYLCITRYPGKKYTFQNKNTKQQKPASTIQRRFVHM